jgi:tRNA pseudouridine55 synthase
MDGFIVVDKPAGMTSHAVVSAVRRIAGQKKAGHTGTLDPFATGVLPVALGEGTKAIPFLDEAVKEYRAVMRLGAATDTQDCTGTVIREGEWREVTREGVNETAALFTGRLLQVPPMYSALKRDGVPLYRLARRGEEVAREARPVDIHELAIEEISLPDVAFRVRCSRGTYVRTLANDIGERLGCGAHLIALCRALSGAFSIDAAVSLDRLTLLARSGDLAAALISPYAALSHLRDIPLTAAGMSKVRRGIVPAQDDCLAPLESFAGFPEMVRLSFAGNLVAVAELCCEEVARMRLLRVFNELSPLHAPDLVVKRQDAELLP